MKQNHSHHQTMKTELTSSSSLPNICRLDYKIVNVMCSPTSTCTREWEWKRKKIINMCFGMSSRNKLYVGACRKKKERMCIITEDESLSVICRINSQHMLWCTMRREWFVFLFRLNHEKRFILHSSNTR